ncbi:hypothetical protein [Prosthecobacter sp.]|uniref:hypothetical protein n=1 Tax=Prosthecobacter sp. TaxID=1965333 RepID=UPI001DEF6828|nr:hypothetical protein [Prosthecobacter sp.]MCB1278233.1 hypothetical protein [Prosthecobacter sp.]
MGTSITASAENTPASGVQVTHSGGLFDSPNGKVVGRVEAMIDTELPAELRETARGLLRAVANKVAVPGHFDAFCCQAFSKPEWAAASSPLIAEMFEEDEDQLAELARIPDLVIEMGSGQVNVTCMVASRWAARGETHRLSRLADAIVASHASKNTCAVDVMLALAATLAVTRFSRAEQLYNAALPLAGEEHQEALGDARRWLAAGRVVCSASQEQRDFWDIRLRKPRTNWSWQSKEEREALDMLSERLSTNTEGADVFKAVLPECWWELALKCAHLQEKMSLAAQKPAEEKMNVAASPRMPVENVSTFDVSVREARVHSKAGPYARFVLGWICGSMAMVLTVLVLPSEVISRILNAFRTSEVQPSVVKTPEEMEAWRGEMMKKVASELTQFAPQHAAAKSGIWRENEQLLSGRSQELPESSAEYMKFLVWLHLDPPQDEEVRIHVCSLLLNRVKADAISLWEQLVYPGSANAAAIRKAAGEALTDSSYHWNDEELKRLRSVAEG